MSWSWSTRPQGKSKKMHLQPLYKFLSRKRLLSPNQKSEEASGITAFVMLNHSSMPHMAAHRLLCKGLWRRGENLRSRNPSPAVMTHCLYQTPAHSPSGITVNTAWAALYRARGKVDSRVLEGLCVRPPSRTPQPRAGHTADPEIHTDCTSNRTTWEDSCPFKRRPG